MKHISILITLVFITIQVIKSQKPPRETFNIYFENNFSYCQIGDYSEYDFRSNWIDPSGSDRRIETDIVLEENNRFMRGYFPKGSLGPSEGGWSWYAPISQKTDEIYFSYDIRFKPDFNWVHGGKIPGIVGGRSISGVLPAFSDGFSVRLMWKGYGALVYYVYHHDQQSIYGSSYEWEDFKFQTGKWYNLTMRVVLNTVGPNGGEKNGILEGFIDGKLVFQKTDLRLRNMESIKIDRMYICSFFGGNEDLWRAARDEWIDTDNYICFNYGNKILGVPRGFQTSLRSKELIHPYRSFSDTQWKASIKYSTLTSSTVRLMWDNYPVPAIYKLERRDPESSVYTSVATLPYENTFYTDSGLSPSKIYTYRITAGNSVKEILVSPNMVTPNAPTDLRSFSYTNRSITLTWKDNSNNEESFILTRYFTNDPLSRIELMIKANDTIFVDSNLVAGTSYLYTVKAVNTKGGSDCSNKSVATTLSNEELKRVREGLIAYYDFGYNADNIVYDQSGYDHPVNLMILNPNAIRWNENNTMDILSNTALVSMTTATKIIKALKQTNELTFECWIKPDQPDGLMNSRIVSLAKDDADVGFLIDQDYSNDDNIEALKYKVRLQTESTISSGYPEYQPNCMQSYINIQHLVYCRNHRGYESLFINGVKSSEGFRPNDLCTWKDDYILRLGNESDMGHAWRGSFYSVAFYNKAFTPEQVLVNYSAGPCDKITTASLDYTIEVFPNPVKNFAKLEITPTISSDFVQKTIIRLTDVYGKLLVENTLFNPSSPDIKNIDFTSYSNGIYFIHLISGNEQKIKKVIVAR